MDCEPVRAEGKKRIQREEKKKKNMKSLFLNIMLMVLNTYLFFLVRICVLLKASLFPSIQTMKLGVTVVVAYFTLVGKVVICNLTTKKLKLLTPPGPDAFYCDHGLGYDRVSDDYKVIRNHNPATTAEVYSLKNDSWKVIQGPGDDVSMDPECGVYMEDGRSYWITVADTPGDDYDDFILSFDFTTETFSRMPLPPALRPPVRPPLLPGQYDPDFKVHVFDCDGCLGVVGFKRLVDHKARVAMHFELWVYRGESWERSFSVILLDVERPLGLSDNRYLYLEGNNSCGHRHLMIYDWVKEELREHNVYVKPPNRLLFLTYVENTVELPNAKPLFDNDQDSSKKIGSSLEGMGLKRCSGRREKS
ncbi:hypothetical protein OROHE_026636 [Orobanche hederae]